MPLVPQPFPYSLWHAGVPMQADGVIKALASMKPTVWDVVDLAPLPQQLDALTAAPAIYSLRHPPAPSTPLAEATLAALLSIAVDGMAELTFNGSPQGTLAEGRRPAYLLELVLRASQLPGASADVRAAVVASRPLTRAAAMWTTSVQPLLRYAASSMRCGNVSQADREHLSFRVGNLLSAFHNLAALLRQLRIRFATLVDGSAAQEAGPPAEEEPWPGGGRSGQQDAGVASLLQRVAEVERLVATIPAGSSLLIAWNFLLAYEEVSAGCVQQKGSCQPAPGIPHLGLRIWVFLTCRTSMFKVRASPLPDVPGAVCSSAFHSSAKS